LHGEAFNFGPRAEQNRTVVELLGDFGRRWGFTGTEQAYRVTADVPFHESSLLKLNCDKALFHLKWEPNLDYPETIALLSDWYIAHFRKSADMYALTVQQIATYERIGAERNRIWARQN
jgi:CDP-glucose 4,6-dehydratase